MTHLARSLARGLLRMSAVFGIAFAVLAHAAEGVRTFNIPAGDAEESLKQFTAQSGEQILYPPTKVAGVRTNAVAGELTPDAALYTLLRGTVLVAVRDTVTGAYTIQQAPSVAEAEKNGSSRPAGDRAAQLTENGAVKLGTFEVMGSKLLNMDIARSRDDAQPYVIFNRDTITNSGATSLDDFLKQRLTMNTTGQSPSQFLNSTSGNTSSINLRGLGAEQTLILVDGHRIASFGNPIGLLQPDINGIPLAAIERIEVLPTTASGIYGGSATGGVVNIILRRDYAGAEVRMTYENTFDTDAAIRSVDLSAGFTLEGGKTNVLLAASYRDSNYLLYQDRDFIQRGRALVTANNPSSITSATVPPLGSTTNIRSSNGSNLTLKNGVALNSPITFVPAGYANSDGGAALVANAGRYNLDLGHSAQIASFGTGGLLAMGNAPTVKSITTTIRRQFSPKVQLFLDASAANNAGRFINTANNSGTLTLPASAPTNPFNQAITVMVPQNAPLTEVQSDVFTRRAVLGALLQLPGEWKAEADLTWSRTRFYGSGPGVLAATLNSGIAAGTIDVLRDLRAYPIDFSPYVVRPNTFGPANTTLLAGTARGSGPVWELPAGPVVLSGLAEYRDEFLDDYPSQTATALATRPRRSQTVGSGYLETRVPLISAKNALPGLRELELQLAVRRDEYAVTGAIASVVVGAPVTRATNRTRSTNPTLGLRYSPVRDVMLRASFGTGFLPPSVAQLVPSVPANANFAVVDPKRGNQPISSSYISGGNPNLQPEDSESWGAGVVYTPQAVKGLRVSLDYARIKKRNNIIGNLLSNAVTVQTIVLNEASFPGRIVRGAKLPDDPADWAGPIVFMDMTAANLSSADLEALDGAIDYRLQTGHWGTFDLYVLGTYQLRFDSQLVAGTPIIQNVGVNSLAVSIPVELKANGGMTWQFRRLTAGWNVRYADGFLTRDPTQPTNLPVILSQGNGGRVSSEIYHDAFVSYRFPSVATSDGPARFLAGFEVQVGLKNVFDRMAAFDAGSPVFYYNYLGETRGRSYVLSVKRSF